MWCTYRIVRMLDMQFCVHMVLCACWIWSDVYLWCYVHVVYASLCTYGVVCVMKPAQENIEKIDQRLRNQPLRGGNLLYITQMNNFWMIQMTRHPFYI